MMVLARFSVIPLLALFLVGVVACAKPSEKPSGPHQTVLVLNLRASQNLNPDDTGRASPLRLRFYELKSSSIFNSADFFSLYDHDKEVLAADLVVREEIQVEPGMQKNFTRKPRPEAAFIAVLAPYRDIDHATWRASMEVRTSETTDVELKLERLAVSLIPVPKK